MVSGACSCGRNGEPEGGASLFLACQGDLDVLKIRQLFDNREAETGAACAGISRLIHPVEALENSVDLLFRNPDALVGYGAFYAFALLFGPD